MILAAVLLFGVVVIGWCSPRLLGRLTAGGISPGTALAWWLLTALGVLVGALGAVLLLVLPDHGPAGAITRILHECWAAVGHSGLPGLDPLAGTFAGTAVAIAAAGSPCPPPGAGNAARCCTGAISTCSGCPAPGRGRRCGCPTTVRSPTASAAATA
ncbi:hypothetical protein [Amycolatopsis coloradensis]|uniref:hypothetical protein n=1 Tax=Amycolatopsis coloradensis TaxID=76021 RepID=UPI003CC909FE